MKITYIYHSSFLVETSQCYYLFDYYKGTLPPLHPGKPMIVFASHNHGDHYNPEIFQLLQAQGAADTLDGLQSPATCQTQPFRQITAVLSKDIPGEKYPAVDNVMPTASRIQCIKVHAHETHELPYGTTLQTLQSTDEGVAFLVRCPEGIIYHAGDLNDWVWEEESLQYNKQMTGSYRHEIDLLRSILGKCPVDVAFIPLDPRQEKDYARGMLYFLQQITAKHVYPMHYWEQPGIIHRFLREYPEYQNIMLTEG